jgi:type IV secretory pathway component VirB8
MICFLHRLNQKAKIIFDAAMEANNENDEETVYIYLMKYCEIVQIMKNNFIDDTDYIVKMNSSSLRKSMQMLSHVKMSLENRYESNSISYCIRRCFLFKH